MLLHRSNHCFDTVEFRRNVAAAFRQKIRARVRSYERSCHLPVLIHCPEEWLHVGDLRISLAILRRLKLALYQQRQARAIRHYTFSRQKYEALLVAIGGELALMRQMSKTGQLPAEIDSPLPTPTARCRVGPYSFL